MLINKHSQSGFTLVEMLVVVPIALILIAVLVNSLIKMTNSATVSNVRTNRMSQLMRALDMIEQDVAVSNQFLSKPRLRNQGGEVVDDYVSDEQTNPQLSDSVRCGVYPEQYLATGSCGNRYTAQPRLIINRLATITKPDADVKLKVLAHFREGSFSVDHCKYNPPLFFNVVYFIKDGNLYRRNILPRTLKHGVRVFDSDLLCSWKDRDRWGNDTIVRHLPWHKPTCSQADFESWDHRLYCQERDLMILENAEIEIEYLTGNNNKIDSMEVYRTPTNYEETQTVLNSAHSVRVILKSNVALTSTKSKNYIQGEMIVRKLSDAPGS